MSKEEKKKEGLDEHGNVLPGFPGHYRYRKEVNAKARHGTTGMQNYGKDKKEDSPKEPPKDRPELSKSEIYALNKARQTELIKELAHETDDTHIAIPKLEKDRVNLILKLQKK